jgi:hypothetical protein
MVYRDTKEIRAEEVGTTAIGPVFLKVNYPIAFRRSFWGIGLEPSRTSRETARAEAVPVEVKAPPAAGRPADFTGAIGTFTIQAEAKPQRVQQGQPITLTVRVQGSQVEGVAGPNLTAQPELVSRFDFSTEEVTGDIERPGVKVFRRAIFPKQAGEQTVPSISWSYFDPEREIYSTLRSDPIPITVDVGSAAATESLSETATAESRPGGLTVLRGGISPNYVDAAALLAKHEFSASPAILLAFGSLPPLIWAGIYAAAWRRARRRADAGWSRRRSALRTGQRLAAKAMRQPSPQAQLQGLAEALSVYLAHRFDLPPGTLTPDEARELVAAGAKDAETAEAVAGFFAQCDAIRFAPQMPAGITPEQAQGQVRRWMTRIERNGR